MHYEMFKEIALEYIPKMIPDGWKDHEMSVRKVNRVNKTLDGIAFFEKGKEKALAPTIYIQDMYDRYKKSNDIKYAIQSVLDETYRGVVGARFMEPLVEERTADKIFLQMVNKEKNKEMLKMVPHKEFFDLAIIYRWLAFSSGEGIVSMILQHDDLKDFGLNEEEIYQVALKNTKRLFPPVVRPVKQMAIEGLMQEGLTREMAEKYVTEKSSGLDLYAISNIRGINGATAVLYEDTMKELAKVIGSDLYLLPSSLHEMMAVAVSGKLEVKQLENLVMEANAKVVEEKDLLSNQVYRYDKELGKIRLASNGPIKPLSEIGKSETMGAVRKEAVR